MLAEMGVAIGVDGHTVGLFQPRKVITKSCLSYSAVLFLAWLCIIFLCMY